MTEDNENPAMIIAGATRPLSREEVNGLLNRFLVHSHAAEELRARIAKGKGIIASADPDKIDVEDAKVKLAQLEEDERREGWGELIALSTALGHSVASLLNEASTMGSWKPPVGSFVRLKLPGMLDLTIDVTEYGGAGAVTKASNG